MGLTKLTLQGFQTYFILIKFGFKISRTIISSLPEQFKRIYFDLTETEYLPYIDEKLGIERYVKKSKFPKHL